MSSQLLPSVCIDSVFEGRSFSEACSKTKQAGINAIEFWGWWDKDLSSLQDAVAENELSISACCTKFISLVDPAERSSYLEGLADSVAAAKDLGTNTLISQVGDFRKGVSREEQHASLVEGLKEASTILKGSGVTLVIEPLNELVDHAGYYLIRSDEAFEIIEEVGSGDIKVVFDIYHQQISEGNLISNIVTNIDKIGHFHAAGNPGRHELQRGEIDYREIFKGISETSYDGYVGLEYWPVDKDPIGALNEVSSWLGER